MHHYDEAGDARNDMLEKTFEREDHWMKELRTIYPYGQCEQKRENDIDECTNIGNIFHAMPRK